MGWRVFEADTAFRFGNENMIIVYAMESKQRNGGL
jgi:hypothetical protein